MNMSRTPSPESEPASLPPDLANKIKDLQGYYELGMANEVLRMARALIKYRPVQLYAFTEALRQVLFMGEHAENRCQERIQTSLQKDLKDLHAEPTTLRVIAAGRIEKETGEPKP